MSSHAARRQQPASPGDRQPAVLRVLGVGDCNTCGITVPPIGNTIVDKVADALQAAGLPTAGHNLGYGMTTTREGVQRMQRDARPADLVLVNFGLVDTWLTSIPAVYVPYYPDSFLRKWARKLLKFVKRRLRSPALRQWVPVGPVVALPEYLQNVEQIVLLARQHNPETYVLLWATALVREDEQRNRNIARYNEHLRQLADRLDCGFLDTPRVLAPLDPAAVYLDSVHLSDAATDRLGAAMAEIFLQARPRHGRAA